MFTEDTVFPTGTSVGPRDWGEETLVSVVEGHFTFKKILLKKGKRGGLQYHHKKDESGFIVSGSMKIRYDLGDGHLQEKVVSEGDYFHFPTGLVHQEIALEDCVIIEVSTPYLNDRVRVEHLYGEDSVGYGLPTTLVSEIISL